MDFVDLTYDNIDLNNITKIVSSPKCGAISLFVGTTRDNFEDLNVVQLVYEAYNDMALKVMKELCEEVRGKWPAIVNMAIVHRLGEVPVAEASVVIAVSSPHRPASLAAVSYAIDRLKATVPIWKKEEYDNGPPCWKENAECKWREGKK